MKKVILFLLFPIMCVSQGIQFESGSWADVLKKAKSQNKLIFVDAFTTWCGPCKKMTQNIFPDKNVGDFYNKNFINAKFDMEAGDGISMAETYKVEAYPTLLFINGDGKLVHKGIGYIEAEKLISLGKAALDPNSNSTSMIEQFDKGNRNPDFLLKLINTSIETSDENLSKYCSEYYKTQSNLLTVTNIKLIIQTTKNPYSKEFKYLLANESKASDVVDKKSLETAIENVIFNFLETEIDKNDSFEKTMQVVDKTFNDLKPSMSDKYRSAIAMEFAKTKNETALIEKYTIEAVNKYQDTKTWSELNQYAWGFFETVDNKESLKIALKWAIKSGDLDSNFFNNDTVANLCNKLGDKKNARLYATEAIRLGIEAGEDTTTTEELLKKLK